MQFVKVKLFKGKTLKNGKHPIVLQVNRCGYKRITLPYEATDKTFDDSIGRFRRSEDNFNQKNLILHKYEVIGGRLIDDLLLSGKPFDLEKFKANLLSGPKSIGVIDMFEMIIKENQAQDKLKNAEAYRDAMRSLKKYKPNNLSFTDIDYKFLKGYEKHLFERGVGGGGANLYLRTLRACYNEAIKRDFVDDKFYPFKSQRNQNGYSFSHLKSQKQARAITIEDMELLRNYPQCMELDLWLFSYYCGGINLWDITQLTTDNIYGDTLYYIRSKTNEKFTITLREQAKDIIARYSGNKILFPILRESHLTMQQKQDRLKKMAKQINSKLKKVAEEVGIKTKITFYSARHTMASVLLSKGVDTRTIQTVLGHTNLKTTQVYLDSIKKNSVDEALMNL